jgi:phosphocarrier protein HPr
MRRFATEKTMQIRQAIIANSQGIHCRPSAVIVKEFQGYPGRVRITNQNGSCDVSSVMQLLSLEMNPGSQVKIEVMGENEGATADRLVELFQTHFDFPPR